MTLFSEYLRELMQTRQMTVSELARLSGIERTQLSRTLTGKRMLPYHAPEAAPRRGEGASPSL